MNTEIKVVEATVDPEAMALAIKKLGEDFLTLTQLHSSIQRVRSRNRSGDNYQEYNEAVEKFERFQNTTCTNLIDVVNYLLPMVSLSPEKSIESRVPKLKAHHRSRLYTDHLCELHGKEGFLKQPCTKCGIGLLIDPEAKFSRCPKCGAFLIQETSISEIAKKKVLEHLETNPMDVARVQVFLGITV